MKEFLEQFKISGVKWHGNSGYVTLDNKTMAKITFGITKKGSNMDHHGLQVSIIKKAGGSPIDATTFNFSDFLERHDFAREHNDGMPSWCHNESHDEDCLGELSEAIDEYIEMFREEP